MQYQVYKKSNHELIAWIDTKAKEQVVHSGYDIIAGNNLTVTECDDSEDNKVIMRVNIINPAGSVSTKVTGRSIRELSENVLDAVKDLAFSFRLYGTLHVVVHFTDSKDPFGEEIGFGVFDSYVTKDYKHISRTGGYIYGKE